MSFSLQTLGSYKVERTEDYDEMIRVKGSKPEPPHFMAPSHLYKYSETELGFYLKERKNLWMPLGKLLNLKIDIHEAELMIHFPVSMFPKIAEIVPFVKKRGLSGNPERAKVIGKSTQFTTETRHKTEQNELNLKDRRACQVNTPDTLEAFRSEDEI